MHTTVMSLHLSAAWDGRAGKTRDLCRGLVSFLGYCGHMGDRVHTELGHAVGGLVNTDFPLIRGCRC